jgi:hypothetical protein
MSNNYGFRVTSTEYSGQTSIGQNSIIPSANTSIMNAKIFTKVLNTIGTENQTFSR